MYPFLGHEASINQVSATLQKKKINTNSTPNGFSICRTLLRMDLRLSCRHAFGSCLQSHAEVK